MYKIYKTSLHSAIDYAAEELKKYLRMMMTECGHIPIEYDPNATDGFRLGLMQDFGLDVSDVEDTSLDDILYISTDEQNGIIAGDNPRSVLQAVYEYLRQNGCRWLFPGVDGEFIPMTEGLKPVSYRFVPSMRCRANCNEGSEFQQCMYDLIDFAPKIGLNSIMMEFRIPTNYYKRYYAHIHNSMNRPPEMVTNDTILQWKRACEDAIHKRGLLFHDIGHGWLMDAVGIDTAVFAGDPENDSKVSEESRQYIAMLNGERNLYRHTPNYTQFCMSNAEGRKKVVNYAADYAERNPTTDFLHFWLGDARNAQCECENCVTKTPSDWYVIMLNELDAELTRRKLNTRVAFIVYTDTLWPPVTEKLNNPARFSSLFAPITRFYNTPVTGDAGDFQIAPYVRNKNVLPTDPTATFAYFNAWRKIFDGNHMAYEYHFWKHQVWDVGNVKLAEVLNEDIRGYKRAGIKTLIQDGSQRSFFPTGYVFYTYARTMFDSSLTTKDIAKEYFSCAFGEDWEKFFGYLTKLEDVFDYDYLEGLKPADSESGTFYNPAMAEKFAKAKDVIAEGRKLIQDHYNMPYRVQTFSVRLLEFHAYYCELLAEALTAKCLGKDDEADALFAEMKQKCGAKEAYFQTCYDHDFFFYALTFIFEARSRIEGPQIY